MTLVVATASGLWSLELATGNVLKSFKQCEAPRFAFTQARGNWLVAQTGRPLIHHYVPRKEAPTRRFVLPEQVHPISASPDGNWLAAGSNSGRLYVWSLLSGALVSASETHFQAVTCIEWAQDNSAIVSAGADARVCVTRVSDWAVTHTVTAHSLAVTSVVVGNGIWREARVFTCSKDATIVVFDLSSGRILHTLVMSAPVNALAVDPAERALYAGTSQGVVGVPLYRISSTTQKLESVGGKGQLITPDDFQQPLGDPTVDVSALSLSNDAAQLIVGYAEGGVAIYEVGTRQLVRKLRAPKGAVSAVKILIALDEPTDFPTLQRTVEGGPTDFVPTAMDLGGILEFPSVENELATVDAIASDQPMSQPTQPVGGISIEQYTQLKKMYDELWKRHSALLDRQGLS